MTSLDIASERNPHPPAKALPLETPESRTVAVQRRQPAMSEQVNSKQRHSEGVVAMLVQHFEGQQLTRLLDLRASVASGECLEDSSSHFLVSACSEAMQSLPYVRRHPQYHDLYIKSVGLYKEIAQRGLENERSGISA